MRLTFIGSADAFNAAGRGHSSYWVDGASEEPFIVDFGGTALMGIRRFGRDPDELGAVLLTHLHGDHFGGLPFLEIDLSFVAGRTRPLLVMGPKGTEERARALSGLVYGTSITEHARFPVHWREIAPGESAEMLGATIEAHEAVHVDAPEQALCLRVTGRDGGVLAFSGDTEPCEGLIACARDADLLVAECTGMRPPAGPHTTWQDWPALLPRIGARRVILSHLGADVREELPGILADRSEGAPPVDLAEDGLVVEIEGARSSLLRVRPAAPVPSQGRPAPTDQEIHPLLAERWSPRSFLSEPVPPEVLRALFEAARWAPSCFNEQPWRFLVATREQSAAHALLASTLTEGNRSWAAKAPVLGIACASTHFARNGKPNRHAVHDVGQALAHLSVEATARGLSVHQMAGFDPQRVGELCGLPEGVEAVTAFVLGRLGPPDALPEALADRETAPRTRRPKADFVFGAGWSEPPPFA